MAVLLLSDSAKEDLATLNATNLRDYARVLAALAEIEADPRLAEHLLDHGFGADFTAARGTAKIAISKWQGQWKQRRKIWRLRFWKLENQGTNLRITYAEAGDDRQFSILGIHQKSEWDYDKSSNTLRARVLAAYDKL